MKDSALDRRMQHIPYYFQNEKTTNMESFDIKVDYKH